MKISIQNGVYVAEFRGIRIEGKTAHEAIKWVLWGVYTQGFKAKRGQKVAVRA